MREETGSRPFTLDGIAIIDLAGKRFLGRSLIRAISSFTTRTARETSTGLPSAFRGIKNDQDDDSFRTRGKTAIKKRVVKDRKNTGV